MKQENNNLLSQPPAPLYSALRHCGMTNGAGCGFPSLLAGEGARRAGEGYKKAFTLIELLVVVLIIGILAAVALPKYQLAVDKSRYATMIGTARSIENAQDAYYLANNAYATSLDELPLDLQGEPYDGRLRIGNAVFGAESAYTSSILYDGDDRVAGFTLYHRFGGNYAGQIMCFSYPAHRERGKKICQSFGGSFVNSNNSCAGNRPCDTYKLTDF